MILAMSITNVPEPTGYTKYLFLKILISSFSRLLLISSMFKLNLVSSRGSFITCFNFVFFAIFSSLFISLLLLYSRVKLDVGT